MLVRVNHAELTMLPKRFRLSSIRLMLLTSRRTWSYSDRATQNIIHVTASKQ